jgi:hypothetical protein
MQAVYLTKVHFFLYQILFYLLPRIVRQGCDDNSSRSPRFDLVGAYSDVYHNNYYCESHKICMAISLWVL